MDITVRSATQYRTDTDTPALHPEAQSVVQQRAHPIPEQEAFQSGDGSFERAREVESQKPAGASAPVAVFVAHGMGQQLPFETLDLVANGLERSLLRDGVGGRQVTGIEVFPQTVSLGDIRTQRLVMTVAVDGAEPGPPPVHLYEGYWAPLTEGKVTLRDVMRFLVLATWRGLRKGVGQPIERYMFGRNTLHKVPSGAFVALLVTSLALGSLVLLNGVIASVVLKEGYDVLTAETVTALPAPVDAAGTPPGGSPDQALTAIAAGYLLGTVVFGLLLGVAMWTRKDPPTRSEPSHAAKPNRVAASGLGSVRRFWLGALTVLFVLWVLATLLAGVLTLAVLLATNAEGLPDPDGLGRPIAVGLVALGVAVATGIVSRQHGSQLRKEYEAHGLTMAEDSRATPFPRRPLAGGRLLVVSVLIVVGVVVSLGALVRGLAQVGLVAWLSSFFFTEGPTLRLLVWFSLFGVSVLLRNLLVQYFGDVAAYVSAHTLDRFADIRAGIQDATETILRGIYHARKDGHLLYDGVAVVGHSLGSVVAYDALNHVLSDDQAEKKADNRAAKRAPDAATIRHCVDVRERTRLLLTFGSPLDKTAYIFRGQNQSLSVVREALANAVQPLILAPSFRTFPWVNVYSSRDIIGGRLDLYDMPATKAKQMAAATEARPGLSTDHHFRDEVRVAHAAVAPEKCPFCVHDVADPEARIPIVAHTEHWKTRAVFDVLAAAVFETEAAAPAAAHRAATAAEAR